MKNDKDIGVDAGKLRHLVVIQNKSVTGTKQRGGNEYTWIDAGSMMASIETLAGREAEIAHQIVASADYKITMRFIDTVSVKSRIVFGERIFNINKVNNVEQRDRKLILTCTEEQ